MIATPTDPTSPLTGCPLTAALTAVGGKWSMICLYWLAAEKRRFGELRRLMPEISHKVLTETLRDLEREGLITRIVLSESPAHVEYRLSGHGETVKPLIEAMRNWGRNHLEWDGGRCAELNPQQALSPPMD
ncbi:MAG: helix-turn-helix domain-containing protein [Micropepsaceae bacterium]